MKSCEYCGKQYADDVAVCPVDGQPVINQEEKQGKFAAQPEAAGTSFNANWFLPYRPPANTGFLSNGATCFSFRLRADQDLFWPWRLLSSVQLAISFH
jgi:hypothetical protein